MTTLIKNVEILDGTGAQAVSKDVLIKRDRILAIGNFPKKSADIVIDGKGGYLSPGFINVNTDSDHYLTLFDNPLQQDFINQGVTTIVGGLCGSSLAPLLYGGLESIRKWADPEKINVDWHTMEEFLDSLEKLHLGVNFATLVGHATIRRALIGETLRDLTVNELTIFKNVLDRALSEGAYGLSTGLGYVHARQTPYSELKNLAEVLERHNGVYATHLRNEESGLIASLQETIRLTEDTGIKTLINHLRPVYGYETEWERGLSLIENSKNPINIDLHPFAYSVVPIYTLLPLWAQNGGLELMMSHLNNSSIRERIEKSLPKLTGSEIVISSAPQNEYLVGRSLKNFINTRQIKNVSRGLIDLMRLVKLRATILYNNVNPEIFLRNLARQPVWIASNSASFRNDTEILKPESALKTFPKFLKLVTEKGLMPLPLAIKKITYEPALKFGIEDRGVIQEGAFADLVVFKDSLIKDVILNGEVALSEGTISQKMNGRILRKIS